MVAATAIGAALLWALIARPDAAWLLAGGVAMVMIREGETVVTKASVRVGQLVRLDDEESGRIVDAVRGDLLTGRGRDGGCLTTGLSRWRHVIPPRPDYGSGPAGGSAMEADHQDQWDALYKHLRGAEQAGTVSLLGRVSRPTSTHEGERTNGGRYRVRCYLIEAPACADRLRPVAEHGIVNLGRFDEESMRPLQLAPADAANEATLIKALEHESAEPGGS